MVLKTMATCISIFKTTHMENNKLPFLENELVSHEYNVKCSFICKFVGVHVSGHGVKQHILPVFHDAFIYFMLLVLPFHRQIFLGFFPNFLFQIIFCGIPVFLVSKTQFKDKIIFGEVYSRQQKKQKCKTKSMGVYTIHT